MDSDLIGLATLVNSFPASRKSFVWQQSKKISVLVIASTLFACQLAPGKESRPATKEEPFTTTIGNVSFIFPSTGYAFNNRNRLISECLDAIKSNAGLIKLPGYEETISVRFLQSRQEMKKYTGMTPAGIVFLDPNIVYIVANGDQMEVRPPIKHELMHMISMTSWGYPVNDSIWMNEGLAAFAENNCNGYTNAQIYRYLDQHDMLIPIEDLASGFHRQPEMIAYHQAAYIVQYLLEHYGVEKFRKLWNQGFASFEEIYSISFRNVEMAIDKKVRQDYPNSPDINWKVFQEGCM